MVKVPDDKISPEINVKVTAFEQSFSYLNGSL